MKRLILLGLIFWVCAQAQAQNIEGQIIASEYSKWRVPGYAANTYSSFAPNSCRVQGGASFFYAFTVGTPVTLVDGNPALTETLVPSATVETDVTCSVTIAPANDHELPFYFTSGTGGLQEALNQNMTTPATNSIILSSEWYQAVGTANAATVIATAKGGTQLNLVDVTTTPYNWYAWDGTQYVLVPLGGGGSSGPLGTLQNDLVGNNASNTAARDLYNFVADSTYTPQQALNAAAAHSGSVTIQPGAGRVPFTNAGNYRVQDNRTDVPQTARSVTEFGATCDTRVVYGFLTQGSTTFSIGGGTLTSADIGKVLTAVGTVSGLPAAFESAVAGITDSLHGTITTPAPFNQATQHAMTLGHDDTAAVTQGMAAVGAGGTLVFPAGICQTHTQTLTGQSPIGLGPNSQVLGFPGEDIFRAPDPSSGSGVNQGAAHIHDLTLLVESRIDATQSWQLCNDSGCGAETPLYRPIAQRTGITNNPLGPGWMVGATNGVAAITSGSAVMCVVSGETAPAVGQTVVFPYLSTVFTATVSSTAGSCTGGASARTLSSTLTATNTQAEWFAGSSVQNLATAIGGGSCPSSITLANNINPVAGWESNVAPFGLIQIDGEQFSYFGRSNAGNTTPANTFYGIQCAQNGTTRAAHNAGATVVPLNRFKPGYPWPVTPTPVSGTTVPANAGYFPGWNVGNVGFAFPVANGATYTGGTGAWSANAKIENLSFFPWPNDINGVNWSEVNNTGMMYFVTPSYASTFANLFGLYLFHGIATGPPSLNNHTYYAAQPTGDGTHWDGLQIWAANPINISLGNQNTFSNFNVYSSESTTTGTTLGADTCMYFSAQWDDQTGGWGDVLSLDHFKNMYCEPESGAHAAQMPQWEWDTLNSEIEDQHMGGGGEVYIGGNQQHWIGGNFNQAANVPAILWGSQNTGDYVSTMGSEPKGNTYGTNSVIDFSWGNRFSGTTSQSFSNPAGPFGVLNANSREPIPGQTNETFNTGNLTHPYVSSAGGLILPEEFNSNFSLESSPMTTGYTYDPTSPISHSYAACTVGNNTTSSYCATGAWNTQDLTIAPDQRVVPGKYTLWMSVKDAVTATNTAKFSILSNCSQLTPITFTWPITNAWPSSLSQYVQETIDLTPLAGLTGCTLGLEVFGATTADNIQVGFLDLAPIDEQITATTINVTNINTPGGNGGTGNGCLQSPVTGIDNGYSCPTKGWSTTLGANQGSGDTTITLATTAGLSPAGCFFVDGEYECYGSIIDGTHLSLILPNGASGRAAYTTTASSHSSGATAVSVNMILGSIQQAPVVGTFYGGVSGQLLAVNNGTPFNHGGLSILSINNGGNETWVDIYGTIHQTNASVTNGFAGMMYIGSTFPVHPYITDSGYLMQSNVPGTMMQPQALAGGHAGSLNVVAPATIGAPTVFGLPSGSSTASWVCTGLDVDGNTIPGTTTTLSSVVATWSFPTGTTVACPWSAGVVTYSIWRTAGGGSQGLLGSGTGTGNGYAISDYGGATSGGTPPVSNTSNPHISVAGTGNPTIQLGATNISTGTGAPTSTCGTAPIGSGSLWLRTDGGASTSVYSCAGTTWSAVTIP